MGDNIGIEGLLKSTGSKRVTPDGGGKEPAKVSNSKVNKSESSYKQWEDNFKKMLTQRRSVKEFRKFSNVVNFINNGQGNKIK